MPSIRSRLSSIQLQCLSIDLLFPLLCLSVLLILWVSHRTGLCGVPSETKALTRRATAKRAPVSIERGDCYVLGTNFITFTPNNNPTGEATSAQLQVEKMRLRIRLLAQDCTHRARLCEAERRVCVSYFLLL